MFIRILKITFFVSLFNIPNAHAESRDLSGIWFQPSRAILYQIKMDKKVSAEEKWLPIIEKVYTKNIDYCIEDTANTKSMKNKFINASRIDVSDNHMMVYEYPNDYPNRGNHLIKLSQLPENCIIPMKTKDPKSNFDALWSFFNSYYPSFNERLSKLQLSWRDLYTKYSQQLKPKMSDRELFNVMGNMLDELHDQHIDLYFEGNADDDLNINNNTRDDVNKFNQAFASSYEVEVDSEEYNKILGKSILNNFHTIETKYLEQVHQGSEKSLFSIGFPSQPVYTWGLIKNTKIGYLRILQELHFTNESIPLKMAQYNHATKTIDNIIEFFRLKGINKLIIDIRMNFGGDDAINDYLLQYLITSRRVVLQNQEIIEGVNQSIHKLYLQPNQHPLRTTSNLFPIIVLTSNQTVSAGEELTLKLKSLSNVTQIGYKTNGVFASTFTRMLPNGWIFQLPFDRNMSYDGKYYEGIGIPPDVEFLPKDNYLIRKYSEKNKDIMLDSCFDSINLNFK